MHYGDNTCYFQQNYLMKTCNLIRLCVECADNSNEGKSVTGLRRITFLKKQQLTKVLNFCKVSIQVCIHKVSIQVCIQFAVL